MIDPLHPPLPFGWREFRRDSDWPSIVGWVGLSRPFGLSVAPTSVLVSVEKHGPDFWYHASIAHPTMMPSYEDLCFLKKHWLGDDRKAVMVLPPKSEHVNDHPFCLHLYSHRDGRDGLPDFRMMENGTPRI